MKRLLIPHLAIWLVGGAIVRIGLVPPETCPPVDPTRVEAAIRHAADWIGRGIDDTGRYTYGYQRDMDRVNRGYNTARHAGTTTALFLLAAGGDDTYVKVADAALGYVFERLTVRDDWTAFTDPSGDVALGANSLFVAALAQRRIATGDPRHDELMQAVGRFIASQEEADGKMLAWWDDGSGAPIPGVYGQFATGEAAWALALLHRLFPGEGWDAVSLRVLRYLATDRVRAEGYTTRVPDHWAAYALAELGPGLLDDELITYARRLAGYFATRIRFESQRTGEGINLMVRWHPGTPSGVGTAGEGLGALFRLAGVDPRLGDLRAGMADTLGCLAGMMVERQQSAADATGFSRPDLVQGAWFYRGYTQVDDQQHVIAALYQSLPAIDEETRT